MKTPGYIVTTKPEYIYKVDKASFILLKNRFRGEIFWRQANHKFWIKTWRASVARKIEEFINH